VTYLKISWVQAKAALHGHHNGSKLVGTWLAGTVVSIALVTAPAKADDLSAGQEVFNNTCGKQCYSSI